MKKWNKTLAAIVLLIFMTALAGCASIQSGVHDLHGSIIGNEYYIDTFDNTGIRTLRTHGSLRSMSSIWIKSTALLPGSWIRL